MTHRWLALDPRLQGKTACGVSIVYTSNCNLRISRKWFAEWMTIGKIFNSFFNHWYVPGAECAKIAAFVASTTSWMVKLRWYWSAGLGFFEGFLIYFWSTVTKEDFYQFCSEMYFTVNDKARWNQIFKFIFTFCLFLWCCMWEEGSK